MRGGSLLLLRLLWVQTLSLALQVQTIFFFFFMFSFLPSPSLAASIVSAVIIRLLVCWQRATCTNFIYEYCKLLLNPLEIAHRWLCDPALA